MEAIELLTVKLQNILQYPLSSHKLFIHAFIFTKKKESSIWKHTQRPATSFHFEYYTRFVCPCIIHVYIFQVKTRSFHSQKEPGICRTLFHAYSKKAVSSSEKEYREPKGSRGHRPSNWIRDTIGDMRFRGEMNVRFIVAQRTWSAALKGLTKIIPSSRMEYRAHTTLTIEM